MLVSMHAVGTVSTSVGVRYIGRMSACAMEPWRSRGYRACGSALEAVGLACESLGGLSAKVRGSRCTEIVRTVVAWPTIVRVDDAVERRIPRWFTARHRSARMQSRVHGIA